MDILLFDVPVNAWQFDESINRWAHHRDLAHELKKHHLAEKDISVQIDGEGYYPVHDCNEPLPKDSYRELTFVYFERNSDIPIGNFAFKMKATRLTLLALTQFSQPLKKMHRFLVTSPA
ncbi:hypothetical protein EC912_101443 [Luteibacter rhizovicinus]|uniref:Uncharacterized protein n=2 Tax=Luteibacter rhizovicinus TaxID=242606 RepID=A0A4R3YXI2_9GAMM|nr:hypothetical protein EC912_101443 [Luteibacter rhizovicinus]